MNEENKPSKATSIAISRKVKAELDYIKAIEGLTSDELVGRLIDFYKQHKGSVSDGKV